MAGVKRCIGLDLGSHSIKLAEMAIDRGGVRIVRMLSTPVPVGPDALEEDRNAAIVAAVRALLKQHKITTKRAVFSMPGQTVFVRRVRVPRAPGPRLHQIIQFEARQLIPFPLEKTMLQYQVFPTEEEREVEVLLVAMKKETNQSFMRLIRRLGLRPIGISVSPLALFNGQELFRFNVKTWQAAQSGKGGFLGLSFGKAGKKAAPKAAKTPKPTKTAKKKKKKGKEEAPEVSEMEDLGSRVAPESEPDTAPDADLAPAGFEEVRAYLNIGARSTDLAVCKPAASQSVGFTRSIPLAGNHITAAIQKACRCDTVTQAENIKTQQTAILSGTFEFEADRSRFNEQASAAATALADRIIAEIRRSLDYFISQPDGVAVDLVVLSGGNAQIPHFAAYIEERLGLPVEISTTLNNDQIKRPSQYADDFDFSPYKIALGLATQGLGLSPLQVDFLPAEIQSVRDFSSQYLDMAALVALIALMVFFGSQLGGATRQALTAEIQKFETHLALHEPRMGKVVEAWTKRNQIQDKLKLVAERLAPRAYWLQLIVQMDSVKPAGVLVISMNCAPRHAAPPPIPGSGIPDTSWLPDPKAGNVTLVVEAEQLSAITLFARNLQGLTRFVKSVHLNPIPRAARSEYFQKPVPRYSIVLETKAPDDTPLTHLSAKPAIHPPVLLGPDGLPVYEQGLPGAPGMRRRERRYEDEEY